MGFTQSAPQASANPDTLAIKIGETLKYELTVKASSSTALGWPAFNDSIGSFEILDKQPVDTTDQKDFQQYTQTLTLTSFQPGRQSIPTLGIAYQPSSGASDTLYTDSFSIRVSTVKVDTSEKQIQPLKGLMDVPLTFREVLPYLIGGFGLIALVVLGYWLYRRWKHKKHPASSTAEPLQMPHEKALQDLKALEDEQLWQQGYIKEYHDQLTDIIRTYLERIVGINAMEQTTNEIMRELHGSSLTPQQQAQLEQLFNMADMAKFAKAQPSSADNQQALQVAYNFVHETRGPAEQQTSNFDNQKNE